jgi:hypothetical protein
MQHGTKKELRIGTWNVLTLYKGGAFKQLEKVLQNNSTTGYSLDWTRCLGEEELLCVLLLLKKNTVVLVRKRTIPTERLQPAGEVSANFS